MPERLSGRRQHPDSDPTSSQPGESPELKTRPLQEEFGTTNETGEKELLGACKLNCNAWMSLTRQPMLKDFSSLESKLWTFIWEATHAELHRVEKFPAQAAAVLKSQSLVRSLLDFSPPRSNGRLGACLKIGKGRVEQSLGPVEADAREYPRKRAVNRAANEWPDQVSPVHLPKGEIQDVDGTGSWAGEGWAGAGLSLKRTLTSLLTPCSCMVTP